MLSTASRGAEPACRARGSLLSIPAVQLVAMGADFLPSAELHRSGSAEGKARCVEDKRAQLSPDESGDQGAGCKTDSNDLVPNECVPSPLQRSDENLSTDVAEAQRGA